MFLTSTSQTLQAGEGAQAAPGGDILIIVMIGMLVLMVVMTMRRGRRMRQTQREAHSGAVVGAEVVTAGGMVGTVVARDEEQQRVTIEFRSGDRADFILGAVQQVTQPAPGASPASDADTEPER